jgi:hypothetical protein
MTIPEVPPVPGTPDEPDVPGQPPPGSAESFSFVEVTADSGDEDASAGVERVDQRTRKPDERDATRKAGSDRSLTVQEEIAAEEAERQIESELGSIAEHHQEMTRLGAAVEGEGHIP